MHIRAVTGSIRTPGMEMGRTLWASAVVSLCAYLLAAAAGYWRT
jgi:hypothetical protein